MLCGLWRDFSAFRRSDAVCLDVFLPTSHALVSPVCTSAQLKHHLFQENFPDSPRAGDFQPLGPPAPGLASYPALTRGCLGAVIVSGVTMESLGFTQNLTHIGNWGLS